MITNDMTAAQRYAAATNSAFERGSVRATLPGLLAAVGESWLTDFMKPYDEAAVLDTLASQEAVLRIQAAADGK